MTDHMPFSVMEAYKSVRTNLIFSLPEESCKKILITSALPGEGKSITAINLALSFAQNKSRVLLIDCDLRLPTTASKLGTKHVPGLTNVLVGIHSMRDALQHFPVGLDYLPAGDIPPNPVELLGTKKMEQLVEELSQSYDYIIFDDPPVEELSDSIVLSKLMSGVVFVVKTGSTTHGSLDSAVSRLQMSGAKILGFIMTQAPLDHDRKYAYKKKYGYGYGYGYASSYANAQKTGEQV
ncbi:MAG: CpsD/CapB family tyrosine-protein kinase [Eubacteriales bacterium]|nr:CpsD/CapB family tyrosine-protein kinase [Eubacteriales bacterium]